MSRRAPLILAVLGVLIVTFAWWAFLISPRNSQIADLDQEKQAAIDTESRLRAQIVQLQEIRDREVEYLAALGRLDSLIPERPLLEEFIEQVNQLALDTGVDLKTLSPSLPTAVLESELREILVSLQIDGQFFEVIGFLFGLNDMERLVRVDAISVSSSTSETGTSLSVTLEVRLFTLADVIPLLGIEQPTDGEGETPTETTTTTIAPTTTGGAEAATTSTTSGEVSP